MLRIQLPRSPEACRHSRSTATDAMSRPPVEEVDVDKLKAMVHVKYEDIAKLDDYVVADEARR